MAKKRTLTTLGQHLLTAALALGAARTAAATELARVPPECILEAIDDDVCEVKDAQSRLKLARFLATSKHAVIREQVAKVIPTAIESVELRLELLAQLANDHVEHVREQAVLSLASELTALPMADRIELVAQWAINADASYRLAVAQILRHSLPVLGRMAALEHLSHDRLSAVRKAVARSAIALLEQRPRQAAGIIVQLADDTTGDVRRLVLPYLEQARSVVLAV